MEQRVNFVTLAAKDFPLMLHFYKDGLAWRPFTEIEHTIAFFNVGGWVFALCEQGELERDVGMALDMCAHPGTILSQNVSSKEAVDEAFEQIIQANGRIIRAPEKASWGGYRGFFADPEDHIWEIAYNPQFSFNANGQMQLPI